MSGGIGILSYLPVLVIGAGALILCYAGVSMSAMLSNDNHHDDDNPVRLVSDFQSPAFSIIHDDDDHALAFNLLPAGIQIEAIYQFGDSIADTGNIILEQPDSVYGNLPYGETFFHKPTGRCSNGLLIIDYIANYLNLPFLDPYLNKDGNFTHGANFAVAGASALNISILAKKGITYGSTTKSSLLVQLDWFKSHLNSICSSASGCKEKLSKALIIMGEIGGNDYNGAFFQTNPIIPIIDIYKLVPEVAQVIKKAIKEVIDLGALRIVVPGNFPIGCLTVYLEMFETNDENMYDELHCLNHLNKLAKIHNNKIQEVIEEVRREHPNVTIVYADYFTAVREILRNATSLGFDPDIIFEACCPNCGTKAATACEHPYKHLSWDGEHLTQHVYQLVAKWVIKFNFQALSSAI